MLISEKYPVNSTSSFDVEIRPAASDGKKYPIVVLLHGNFGLVAPFGDPLRTFTEQIGALGYLAALPSYYDTGVSNLADMDVDSHVDALAAAIRHLAARSDADATRVALVGFSLGGGISLAHIQASAPGAVSVFVDFFGFVGPKLAAGVDKVPPTIIFHNKNDKVVRVHEHSEPFAKALAAKGKIYEPVPPYDWYDERWLDVHHAFEPNKAADKDSRDRTAKWLQKHLPPVGR